MKLLKKKADNNVAVFISRNGIAEMKKKYFLNFIKFFLCFIFNFFVQNLAAGNERARCEKKNLSKYVSKVIKNNREVKLIKIMNEYQNKQKTKNVWATCISLFSL